MINLKSLLVYILDCLKKIRLGGIFTGNITVDKTGYSEATSARVGVVSGDGSGNSIREISLLAGSTSSQNAGIYDTADQNWLFYNSGADSKTYIPALAMSSTATGTVSSTFSEAGTHSCSLYKIGKIVFMSLALHYSNASSTIPMSTTIFTIPTGYRPVSNATILANIGIKTTSSITNPCATCTLKISTAGAVTQAYSSNIYSIYAFGMWETS